MPTLISNSFGVKAHARREIALTSADQLEGLPGAVGSEAVLILGGASNVLFRGDFEGTVIRNRLTGISTRELPIANQVLVRCAAGEPWAGFVDVMVAQGLWGLENLSLIPGCVGASPIQNIGAYGVEVCDRFFQLKAFHIRTGETKVFNKAGCRFAYRDSVFKDPEMRDWLIVEVSFVLDTDPKPTLHYGDLKIRSLVHARSDKRTDPNLADIAQAVKDIRRSKLPDPSVLGNAGSFFKNPIVHQRVIEGLTSEFPGLPVYALAERSDAQKVSAGWLIDQCGWKGHRRGDAGVHQDHALVLVNYGNATGEQIWALASDIQASVQERFGILIEPEPILL
jgi:UDP-N-acetylmuramate dehydrogenase